MQLMNSYKYFTFNYNFQRTNWNLKGRNRHACRQKLQKAMILTTQAQKVQGKCICIQVNQNSQC